MGRFSRARSILLVLASMTFAFIVLQMSGLNSNRDWNTKYLLHKREPDLERQHVAIIVPYRDREIHLKIFTNYMGTFLQRQNASATIYITEQDGSGMFNRAKLFNVGYAEAKKDGPFTCFIFHDIDLLPENHLLQYTCSEQPKHMSAAVDKFNYRLPYSAIFGGVSAISDTQMKKYNGFSNNYWGWGGEDDDVYKRITAKGDHIVRPPMNLARYTMLRNTGKHTSSKQNGQRFNLLRGTTRAMATDGLNSLQYKVLKKENKGTYVWILADLMQNAKPIVKATPTTTTTTTTAKPSVTLSPECVKTQVTRSNTAEKACKDLGKDAHVTLESWMKNKNVFVMEKEKLVYCYVPGTSGLSWKTKLLTHLGVIKEKDYKGVDMVQPNEPVQNIFAKHGIKLLSSYKNEDALKMLKSYYKFAFFSNPYERLFYIYSDKLNNTANKHYTERAKAILQVLNITGTASLTFENFLTYLSMGNHNTEDIHWNRYNELCNPCQVKYDFVGHEESSDTDTQCLLPTLHMSTWFPKPSPGQQSKLTENATKSYSTLPKELLNKIKAVYDVDANTFGYNVPLKQ